MTKGFKQFASSSKRKSSTGRKQSSQKTSRKQKKIKENKVSRKLSREKEKVRKSGRKSLRKDQRSKKRKSKKTAKRDRKKQRKRKRKLSGEKKSSRKEKRKRRRKQKRAKLRRIEDSRLGKPIPKEKMEMFRENFRRGKQRVGGSKNLKNVENPFEKRGTLRSDFRQLVRKKVTVTTYLFKSCFDLQCSRWSKSFLIIANRWKILKEKFLNYHWLKPGQCSKMIFRQVWIVALTK